MFKEDTRTRIASSGADCSSHGMARPLFTYGVDGLQTWRTVTNIFNKLPGAADKGWSYNKISWRLTISDTDKITRYEMLKEEI